MRQRRLSPRSHRATSGLSRSPSARTGSQTCRLVANPTSKATERLSEQGTTYYKFVEAELGIEYDRRASLNSRAKEFSATSSAFIALVVALLALIVGKDYKFTALGAWSVVLALAAFVAASLLALLASMAKETLVTNEKTVQRMLSSEHWKDNEVDARNTVATLNARTTWSLRNGNNVKASRLEWALRCQVGGYVLLTIAAGLGLAKVLFDLG